ncbi:MAG: DUF4912 domain-containing protein [Elusimicrobia bacterium]|nr:DUF4912 domain-containing protein [Elusimicrobiota bacterium]
MASISSPKPEGKKKVQPSEAVYVDTGYPIPERYNEDRLIILPRDPHWIFAYWDLADRTVQKTRKKYGKDIFESSRFALRLHDITGIKKFSGSNSHSYKEIIINNTARSWYIDVENPGKKYCVQLGLKTKDGRFISLLISNSIVMPTGRVSDVIDEQWMLIFEDYEKLLKLSGIDKIGAGSLDMAKLLAKRWEFLGAISSGAFSSISSRFFKAPSSIKSDRQPPVKPGKFWLTADAELIVYGATELSATLKINNKLVKLNPDGTFSLKVGFPAGKKEFAIKAISADKVKQRKITIAAERKK